MINFRCIPQLPLNQRDPYVSTGRRMGKITSGSKHNSKQAYEEDKLNEQINPKVLEDQQSAKGPRAATCCISYPFRSVEAFRDQGM